MNSRHNTSNHLKSIVGFLLLTFCLSLTAFSQTQEKETKVEKFAQYPGGAEQFYEYIQSKVNYPLDARRDSIAGVVFVEFIVDATGEIRKESVKIAKGLSASCDAEAIRVIKGASKWTAATSKAGAIEQKITFPVSFKFE